MEYSIAPAKIICELDKENQSRRIALLDGGNQVLEFVFPSFDRFAIGAVCVGRIAKKIPNTNSYFVTIGKNKSGFMPAKDNDNLPEGQKVMVQITKAAHGIKSAKLTCDIPADLKNSLQESFAAAQDTGVLYDAPDVLKALIERNIACLDKVICDDLGQVQLAHNVVAALGKTMPEVVMYRGAKQESLFDSFGLNDALEDALNPCFIAKEGYRIFFEKTEAFWAVDVDSYNSLLPFNKINKLAALEILRQIRLRNMSGQIVIDFISNRNHRVPDSVIDVLKSELGGGTLTAFVAGVTPLGHIEIVRSREYPALEESVKTHHLSRIGKDD